MLKIHTCDFCQKEFERLECRTKGRQHLFCSRKCLANYSSKAKNPDGYTNLKDFTNMKIHCSELAKKLNPTRMTAKTKEKLHKAHYGKQENKSYRKYYGRHEHRVVMEKMIGRLLKKSEVVHHIDGNKSNNSPENLMLFSSQAKHAEYHASMKYGENYIIGGGAE